MVTCKTDQIIIRLDLTFSILKVNYIDYCFQCPTLVVSTLLNYNSISFEHIALLERNRATNVFQGQIYCRTHDKEFSLCTQIPFFIKHEPKAIIMPLKNLHNIKTKYTDNVQMLAFAYTSVIQHLIGNVTTKPGPNNEKFSKKFDMLDFLRGSLLLKKHFLMTKT